MNAFRQELSRGWQLHQAGQIQQAEAIYRRVLDQTAQDPNAWCYLGISLHDQRRYQESVAAYRTALELQPEFPVALNNLGNSLRYLNELDEADACFKQAIELKPDYLNAYKNRGTLHVWTGDLERGRQYYQRALEINPQEAELHRNLGVIYLLQGDFEAGWREYRWRWKVGDLHRPTQQIPVWNGDSLQGKSILLTAEQGLGDTLHFVRLARVLRDAGAHTTVYCPASLLALLQNSPELGPIYPNSLALDRRFDWQCSLLDVADRLQLNADNIPDQGPYMGPAENLTTFWRQRLPKPPGELRIGIAWQGNPDHQADIFRSIPLRHFEPLTAIDNTQWYSLQQGFGSEQLQQWSAARPIETLDPSVDQSSGAFMDTAAIMQTMDLVITSDTSIAHLAGAMGVRTWIGLGYVPDWRWLLERDDSPWYPTVRLFRQQRMGDWDSVFQQMHAELSQWATNPQQPPSP